MDKNQLTDLYSDLAKTAVQKGLYEDADKALDHAQSISESGDGIHTQIIAADLKEAREALNQGDSGNARVHVNHARGVASQGADSQKQISKFESDLAALVGSYLGDTPESADSTEVLSRIASARSVAEGYVSALHACDAAAHAMADQFLQHARENLTESRPDAALQYIECARIAGAGSERIGRDCTILQAQAYLGKASADIREQRFEEARECIRVAQLAAADSADAAADLSRMCDETLQQLLAGYIESGKTALYRNDYPEAGRYAASARTFADNNAAAGQACAAQLAELYFQLAKAAVRESLYTDADTDLAYAVSLPDQSVGFSEQCRAMRTNACLDGAKKALEAADYEQALGFIVTAKSVAPDDPEVGRTCMQILRRLKKKGYGNNLPWDTDRKRREAAARGAKYALRMVYALLLCAVLWTGIALIVQRYFNPAGELALLGTLAAGYLISVVLIEDQPRVSVLLYTLYNTLVFCVWPALAYLICTDQGAGSAVNTVVPGVALFSVIAFLTRTNGIVLRNRARNLKGAAPNELANGELIRRCLYVAEQAAVFLFLRFVFTLWRLSSANHIDPAGVTALEICLIAHAVIVLLYGRFSNNLMLAASPACLCIPPALAGVLRVISLLFYSLGSAIGGTSGTYDVSYFAAGFWIAGGCAYVAAAILVIRLSEKKRLRWPVRKKRKTEEAKTKKKASV